MHLNGCLFFQDMLLYNKILLLLKKMLQKSQQENKLLTFLQENNLIHKRTLFKELQEDAFELDNSPKLSIESVRDITLGVYQVKQAPSYSKEHM